MLRTAASCFAKRSFSTSNHIQSIGVLGAGQMGTGIAFVAAVNAKLNVHVVDVSPVQVESSQQFITKLLDKQVSKNKLTTEERDAALARITHGSSMQQFADNSAGLIVEAATENMGLKQKLFTQLSDIMAPETILATNTSSISITKIAAAAANPDKVIGMHFFSPVPVMKIVEVITGLRTSSETTSITVDLAGRMGKVTTESKDMPGFIANRILMPYINEAVLLLQEGTATKEHIDSTMKLGCAVPMGPLELADFIGLDTCLHIMQVLHEGFGDSKYRCAPLLQSYVDAGYLGKKTGQGFYTY